MPKLKKYSLTEATNPLVPTDGLTVMQRKFLDLFFLNPSDRATCAKKAGYNPQRAYKQACMILMLPTAKEYLKKLQSEADKHNMFTFEQKISKLKQITYLAVPDDAITIKDTFPNAAVQAIAEANKMQGHYSAEKIQQVNVNVDADLKQIDDLMKEYEKEY